MASQFVGHTVIVDLIQPSGYQVRGQVKDVVVGQALTLSKARSLTVGEEYDELIIPAINIANLELDNSRPPSRPPIGDPAIVSFERSSTKPIAQGKARLQVSGKESSHGPESNGHEAQSELHSQASTKQHNTTVDQPGSKGAAGIGATRESGASTSATLVQPFSQISLEVPSEGNRAAKRAAGSQPSRSADVPAKARQDLKSKRREQQLQDTTLAKPALPAAQGSAANGRSHRGTRGKRDRRKVEHNNAEDQNGWATGEVSDLHDMGDFDFEENLSKFDKRKVFDQIKLDDTTADEDRLHTFNRRHPRPGTAGGKNLHYTENVLDSPRPINPEHSSADDEVENHGGSSLNRSARKAATKKVPSRQGSGMAGTEGVMTASGMLRSSSIRSWSKSPHDSAGHLSPVVRRESARQTQRHFTLADSDSYCPCLSPIQMLELEQLATSDFGLSDDMLTENAARCIAESAISLVAKSQQVSPKRKLFLVLAGNTRTGARAIAAARQLLNHDVRVVVSLLGPQRAADLLEPVRRQLKLYCDCKGKLLPPDTKMAISKAVGDDADLVLDALLGMHLSFYDLGPSEQKSFSLLATCLNDAAHKLKILSLDVPSGVDASTGATLDPQGELKEIAHADLVLSLGAPKTGLLSSWMTQEQDWPGHLSVADIGIPNAAWRRFGGSNRKGIDFRSHWVAKLEYHDE